MFHYAEHAKNYGFAIEAKITPDVKAIVDRSRGIAHRTNNGVGFLMKKNKVDVIWGEAKLNKPNEIVVGKTSKKPMEPDGSGAEERAGRGHLYRQAHHRRHGRQAARAARHRAGRQS